MTEKYNSNKKVESDKIQYDYSSMLLPPLMMYLMIEVFALFHIMMKVPPFNPTAIIISLMITTLISILYMIYKIWFK